MNIVNKIQLKRSKKNGKNSRKWLAKIPIVCILAVMTSYLLLPVNACTQAYFNWTWNSSVDPTSLSVRNYSVDLYNHMSFSTHIAVWNGISSNIRLQSYTLAGNGDIQEDYDGDINLYLVDNLAGDILGITDVYKNLVGSYIPINPNSTEKVIHARIAFNESLLGEYEDLLKSTVIHEVGHAIGLCHPSDVGCYSRCIMQPGNSSYITDTIAAHDRNNLRAKWGN